MAHVFIIRGDITHLACDAWMLPTSARLGVNHWKDQVAGLHDRVARTDTAALERSDELATVLAGGAPGEPAIVLAAVPRYGFTDPHDLEPAVASFFAAAADAVAGIARGGRAKPLIAMPYFGTAGGGGASRRGEILDVLLKAMLTAAKRHEVDTVLVLRDPDAYALAQLKRSDDLDLFFPELGQDLREHLEDLAPSARNGSLVPFMGAGVSASAGGPTWHELIKGLAHRVLDDPDAISSLLAESRDSLDQAAALRTAWNAHPDSRTTSFNDLVAGQVKQLRRYGLAPALLAALPANEAITLNYDSLFESAARDGEHPRRVIPRPDKDRGIDADTSNERWLLELHGSVDSPASIVLTRDDYLGYDSERGALSSLVKAMLMTRHLLFVGFGLADDHFHEILYDVRRAVAGQGAGALNATVLKLKHDALDDLLWKKDLDLIAFGSASEAIDVLSRRLEIFLDALICRATNDHSYLMKHGFGRALTAPERQLRKALTALQSTADEEVRRTPAWSVVQEALTRLGG